MLGDGDAHVQRLTRAFGLHELGQQVDASQEHLRFGRGYVDEWLDCRNRIRRFKN